MPTPLIVPLADLLFDPKNPRLVGDLDDNQDRMFRYLITDVGVEDLLESLSTSGLYAADPIIVRQDENGHYFVVEGNRRLAALKLLVGQRPSDNLKIPPVPAVTPQILATFQNVNVESDWPDEVLQAYLGYKHVTASREWSPVAKAKFVFENANGDLSPENLRRFARTLGTKYPTLRRWLSAFLVLRQAETREIFNPDVVSKGYFGTFYTLLGGQQARRYLGLQEDGLTDQMVPEDHIAQLQEFIKWTIGTDSEPASVNSRQQTEFEKILSSPRAIERFQSSQDFNAALMYTDFTTDQIATNLRKAAYSIEDCLAKLLDVRSDTRVSSAFSDLEKAYAKAKIYMNAEVAG